MHNLRHFYYQNKEKIWKVVLFIAFLLGIIYFLNSHAISNETQSNISNTLNSNEIYSDEQNKTYISNQSAISGGSVEKTEVEEINSTISKFLQYCKNGNLEQAYEMISADCKENEYKTLENFQNKYVKSKFDKTSIYKIEKWISNTYKISISKDLLLTGDINNNEKQTEYITITKEDGEKKLNINSYIGKKDINKEATQENIKITAISKKIYLDYEIYNFKIENLSSNTIKLDCLKKIGTIHLEDSNGNTYNAYTNEILDEDLEIKANHENSLTIKYANKYSNKTQIKSVIFENVILNYPKYKKAENIETFEEICELKINL